MSRTGGFCVELVVNESIQSETKYLFTNMSRKKRKAVNVNVRKNSEKAKFSSCFYKGCSVLFSDKNHQRRHYKFWHVNHVCDSCNIAFQTKCEFDKHLSSFNSKHIQCKLCKRTFLSQTNYKIHFNRIHREKFKSATYSILTEKDIYLGKASKIKATNFCC